MAVSRAAAERGTAEERMLAEREVSELACRHGWTPAKAEKNPGWAMLVQIVATYRDLGQGEMLVLLDRYAEAASELAAAELAVVGEMAGTDGKIEGVVLGTVLGDAAMAALRRIAQEDTSQRVTARAEPAPPREPARVGGMPLSRSDSWISLTISRCRGVSSDTSHLYG